MSKKCHIFLLLLLFSAFNGFTQAAYEVDESGFVLYEVDPAEGNLHFLWKDEQGNIYGSLGQLKENLEQKGQKLLFAMNGGMYEKDQSPQGLYIEKGKLIHKLNNRQEGYGNFYLQPNGVFSIGKDGTAAIRMSQQVKRDTNMLYATQSGPLLLFNGQYHPKLNKGSKNLHIRNAVGILANGNVLFAISREPVNFYDLATLFKQNGCKDALYLDGFVSRMYAPEKEWEQLDGRFGVVIAIIEEANK